MQCNDETSYIYTWAYQASSEAHRCDVVIAYNSWILIKMILKNDQLRLENLCRENIIFHQCYCAQCTYCLKCWVYKHSYNIKVIQNICMLIHRLCTFRIQRERIHKTGRLLIGILACILRWPLLTSQCFYEQLHRRTTVVLST